MLLLSCLTLAEATSAHLQCSNLVRRELVLLQEGVDQLGARLAGGQVARHALGLRQHFGS